MNSVTARKIRDHGSQRGTSSGSDHGGGPGVGRVYSGFLVGQPVVGRGLVIFRDPNGHRMVTTPVRRILTHQSDEGDVLYVETENSVYRIAFHTLPVAKAA